jgi:Host cell surface-exposed lipoprotein
MSLSTPDDKPKRALCGKKRSLALAIFGLIIVAAANSGSGVATPSRTTSSGSSVPEQNAIRAAKDYLRTGAFSKQGLIDQLDSSYGDGYSVSVATAAVNSLNVNWYAEAVRSARDYLRNESFSCQGIIQQLSSSFGDKYTLAQARYAARKVGLC